MDMAASSSFVLPSTSACPLLNSVRTAPSTTRHGRCRRRRLSCKATAPGSSTTGGGASDVDEARRVIDRRDVLLGLTGVAAATTTANLGIGLAAAAADTATATPAVCVAVPITDKFIRCVSTDGFRCPIQYSPEDVVEFSALPPPAAGPLRVRRPAHLVAGDADYVRKYEAGIRMMKELDGTDDPRSFESQAAIHQAYCDFHYKVSAAAAGDARRKDLPEIDFDVHFSSVFAPWHRMYIYFFERIIGELVGDSAFALPYWNWDSPDGMALPAIFADESSPLYDAKRNRQHVVNGAVLDLNLGPAANQENALPSCGDDAACLKDTNLVILYRQMAVDTAGQFHGEKFCAARVKNPGTLENLAHTSVHIWTGDPLNVPKGEDMGVLATAGRDPVFYSHHANVDRMWHLWTAALGHADFLGAAARDWLDTGFVFYDERRRPVRVRVRDVLDAGRLGYAYEESGRLEWLDRRPTPATGVDRSGPEPKVAPPTMSFPTALRKGVKEYATVERPAAAREEGNTAPEVLVVDVTVDPCEYAKFDVLVNVPRGQEGLVGPRDSEFAGSFVNLPHGRRSGSGGGGMGTLTLAYRFALRELIEDLKCGRDKTINVTFVPVAGSMVVVDDVRVELLKY